MNIGKIIKTASFWEIILFNALPLLLIFIGQLEFYYFLMYFVLEVIFIGIFSFVKWYYLSRGGSLLSNVLSAVIMMGITLFLYGLAALFLMSIVYKQQAELRSGNTLIHMLQSVQYLIPVIFLRVLIHHIRWVKNKEYERSRFMTHFYSMVITGFGGFFLVLCVLIALKNQIENQQNLAATILIIVVLVFELWNKFGSKKWMKKRRPFF
ncbi:MAG: DUF6498-containing protein [Crocinitomicaceae bacterium]